MLHFFNACYDSAIHETAGQTFVVQVESYLDGVALDERDIVIGDFEIAAIR